MLFTMLFFVGRVEAPNTPFINIYTLIIAGVIAACNLCFWYKEDQFRKNNKTNMKKADKTFNIFLVSLSFILLATHS